ncbi:hypothetical protein [Porphyromonas circumdentaria]|uniref:hypothetical protein n=1 Tax=Porphyromonas circumdentaria TaxID=29524 RepID=UPI0026DAD88A|nr:hypothetical protein [Porphyromonas circumdentaria]MDO4722355.1 hypothetical protein [Porphyromonas circumdentaria]
MEYKKGLYLLLSIGLSLLTLASCQGNKNGIKPNLKETQIKETQLGKVITDGMEKYPTESFYILYSASSKGYTTLTQEDYIVSTAFANLLVRQNNELRADDPPKDEGWVLGGTGKGKLDAVRIAYEIADKIKESKDFEIHVEYEKDGSFTVWYRMVE